MNSEAVKVLLEIAESLKKLAGCLGPEKEQPSVTLEQVRGVLAGKSKEGKTAEVRSLLQKYGADKLSEIKPECYSDLLIEAEGL